MFSLQRENRRGAYRKAACQPAPLRQQAIRGRLPLRSRPKDCRRALHLVSRNMDTWPCTWSAGMEPGAMRRCSEGQDRPHSLGQPMRAAWSDPGIFPRRRNVQVGVSQGSSSRLRRAHASCHSVAPVQSARGRRHSWGTVCTRGNGL